jgi:hypothetical protein
MAEEITVPSWGITAVIHVQKALITWSEDSKRK